MYKLSLPDSIIDGNVIRSNTYALAGTKLDGKILVDGVMKKNPRWMHPNKYRDINQQDILFFFTCYYYLGYYRLPARQDYWVQRKPNSCLPAHWIDRQFPCDKFEYTRCNISLNLLLIDKEVDKTVDVDNDGQFKPETEAEEFVVKKYKKMKTTTMMMMMMTRARTMKSRMITMMIKSQNQRKKMTMRWATAIMMIQLMMRLVMNKMMMTKLSKRSGTTKQSLCWIGSTNFR